MQNLLHGTLAFFTFVIPAVLIMLGLRVFTKIPDELFRKLLHFILLAVYGVILVAFRTWQSAVVFALLVIALFYPVFTLAGKIPGFSRFVNERKGGEFKNSLILALSMMAFCIFVCWGLLDDKLLVLACIYAWGVGDGFAALVGKRFGKHKIKLKCADGKKSLEGSATMFVCSVLSVMCVLLIRGGLGIGACLFISLAAASACTFAELCSKGGIDTVTCPLAAMLVILPLTIILGG